MKITQIRESRENGDTEALSVMDINLLIEKMKKETKLRPVSGLREALHFVLPGEPCSAAHKLPRIIPAAVFGRVNGVKKMKTYNGIVELTVGPLAGKAEIALVKRKAAELPQTMLAFAGSSDKSVKIWTRFTRPDGKLPQTAEEAEIFQAHAYRLAIKCYQPQIPFNLLLKEPKLEQYSRLSYDPDLFYRPDPVPFYLSQPVSMPGETTYREKTIAESSPLNRTVPGYATQDAIALLYEAAVRKTFEELEVEWHWNDDPQALVVRLAENCFHSGIPQEEVTRRTLTRFYKLNDAMLLREMIKNVYQECKGFNRKDCLTKEQRLNLQMEEFMERRYEFRHNTQIGEVEYRERVSFRFNFSAIDKRAQNSIMLDAQSEGIAVWDRDIDRYLHSNRVPVYNPLEEFMFSLPRWDGKDHILALASRVPCKNPYWGMLFHRWFLNMVAHWRGLNKQYANSTSPLLVGAQGFRKSTYCRIILPPELRFGYTDSLDFRNKRDAEMYLGRFMLINIDEFDQVSMNQQGFLKHLLQKPVANLRKPYGSSIQEMRRYASFIGTSNQKDLLTDPSGSRRFICIEITAPINTNVTINYRQLYAQAMEAITKGERYWFDDTDEAILKESNREFEQISPLEQLFHCHFRSPEEGETGEQLSAMQIIEYLQEKNKAINLSQSSITTFGRILKRNQIQSKRTKKGMIYEVIRL